MGIRGSAVQHTLRQTCIFEGVALHCGEDVKIRVIPAAEDHGIVFRRMDVSAAKSLVPARWNLVSQEPLNTRLVNADGVSVATVEHLMAALVGCGIHNALVEVTGPELPVMDGSSRDYVRAFLAAGLVSQSAPVFGIQILRPISSVRGEARAYLTPGPEFRISFEIDFETAAIGRQKKSLAMANGAFVRELCDSRTFCSLADVGNLRASGLAQGGTVENAVVFDGDKVLSPGGLRYSDEAVRHKMLDALGDLALAGGPIIGHYRGIRAGHAITNAVLRALFADPRNWRSVQLNQKQQRMMPGTSITQNDMDAVA